MTTVPENNNNPALNNPAPDLAALQIAPVGITEYSDLLRGGEAFLTLHYRRRHAAAMDTRQALLPEILTDLAAVGVGLAGKVEMEFTPPQEELRRRPSPTRLPRVAVRLRIPVHVPGDPRAWAAALRARFDRIQVIAAEDQVDE